MKRLVACALLLGIYGCYRPPSPAPKLSAYSSHVKSSKTKAELIHSFDEEKVSYAELETLEDYISFALTNSSSLRAAYASYSSVRQRAPQVSSLPDPRLGYGYFISPVETRVGPQEHKFQLAQTFPWFGTLGLRGDVADAEAAAEYFRFLGLKNQLVFDVSKAFAELGYFQSAVQITTDTIELVKSWEGVLQERFRTSSGSHNDLVRTQVELGRLVDRLEEYKDFINPLQASLNAFLNRPAQVQTKISSKTFSKSTASFRLNDAAQLAFEDVKKGNPKLQMLQAVMEAKKAGVALAKKKYYPDFTLGVDYLVTGDRDVPDGGDDAVMTMLSMNLPVFWNKNRARVEEAKQGRWSVEETKRDIEHTLRAELSRAKFELRDAERKISLYRDTLIPKTQESIEASYTAYEGGQAGFLDVLDSEQSLLEHELALSRARADVLIAVAKLHRLAGVYSDSSSVENRNE